MNGCRRLIIPMSESERARLRSEARSYLAFFSVFGGAFGLASVFAAWPFEKIESFRWMLSGVLLVFFFIFLGVYLFQVKGVLRSLAGGKSVMYTGRISRKNLMQVDVGLVYEIYIGERKFEIDVSLYDNAKIGDRIAVREWLKSGEYLDHTTDERRIAELEARALAE